MVRLLINLGLVVCFALGYVKLIERYQVFFPSKEVDFHPALIDLSFEDIYIKTEDRLTLNGWFIPSSSAKYTLLFLHGNGGNIGHRLEKLRLILRAYNQLNILIIDYRGYGRSQGHPSERGIYLDAQAAYDYLLSQRNINPEEIILYGESLGTTVAIDLASKSKVKALILEGGFSSGQDMAKILYPFLPGFLFTGKFDSLRKITKTSVDKLFIHGIDDQVVPFSLGKKLYQAATGNKQLVELSGGHNSIFMDSQDKYLSSITTFIKGFRD